MIVPTKSIFLSKTFWLNAVSAVIAVGGSLSGILPDQYDKYVLGAVSLANILLRLITSEGVHVAKP